MRYLSVCSGIEAASVAWHSLGWTPAGFSEIEKFPSAVLAHHWPAVPNLGDMTSFKDWPDAAFDVLVGGTPCQSFSVAGLRKGLADPRGNLALVYLAIAGRYRPEWVVWENVPGVLSSSGGRDFGSFLGGLAELGYGFAYRVLDAQYFGVAQRRRRVFVVGHLGDWRRAAAVLFERESLQGDSAPRREARQGTTHDVAPSLGASGRGFSRAGDPRGQDAVVAKSLNAHGVRLDTETETFIAHALRAEGFDASEDGTGRGTPLVPIAFDCKASGRNGFGVGEIAPTLRSMGHTNLDNGPQGKGYQEGVAYTLEARNKVQAVAKEWAVRRLTPRECERLQGFPDDYTLIPVRGKPAADGPRYKALGNSMAVPVMRFIGQRIDAVSAVARQAA